MTRTAPPEADPTPKEPAPAVALHTGTSDLRALITRNLRTSGIYVAFVAIVALFAILTDGTSLSPINITNIVLQYSYILVLAIGMVIVIIAGHIDLSVGSVVALTGAVSAVLGIPQGPARGGGLIGGDGYDAFTLLIGVLAVAGYAVSGFRTRLARIRYKQPVESFPLFVARVVLVAAVVMYFAWQLAHARGLPIVLIILGVLITVYGMITKRS